jgi:DEAD/DEAH box helicase domain-containing protein
MVFDLETKRSADEVGGWNNAHLMGIAAGVVYDAREDRRHVFEEPQAGDLADLLAEADLIIGFNQMRFDYAVLSAYTTRDLKKRPNLDLLEEVTKALGRRIGLSALGQATLGRDKTADGLASLRWYKEGRIDLIKEYCVEDVRLTWDLYVYARDNGYLLFTDRQGHRLRIPLDLKLEKFLGPKDSPQ